MLAGFELTDIEAQRGLEAGVIVASYPMALDVIIDGEERPGDPRPFLSSFIWQDGAWELASEAYGEPIKRWQTGARLVASFTIRWGG